jgi:RNA polymerase sigma factor (sigma-70 family)
VKHQPKDDPTADMHSQGRALRALARSMLRSSADADDIVQEAFATELACTARRKDGGAAANNRQGWLKRVVQNLARRRLRDRDRRQQHHQAMPTPSPAPAPDDVLAQVETHRMVVEAVLQLPAPYRRVVVLRFWHDLPPRTIAKQLGIPVATVKTHLQRGIAELRKRLDQQSGGRGAWIAALVPIAHPYLLSGVAAGSLLTLTTTAALIIMNTKHLLLALFAFLCLGVIAWQPWQQPHASPNQSVTDGIVEPQRSDSVSSAALDMASDRNVESDPAAIADSAPILRALAQPEGPNCTVHGRIVSAADRPIANARCRLVNRSEEPDWVTRVATTDRDGNFSLTVARPHNWIPYRYALADAPGWAVRELELNAQPKDSMVDGRLDLGTITLERGVAVTGRVTESDGAPLRSRARLLAWDPTRQGSWVAMSAGRTVGFTEPGGQFKLADRMSAGTNAVRLLAAVSSSGVGWAELEFAAGQQHLDPVAIRLLPGGSVDVQVVDADGAPILAAVVRAVPHFRPIGLAPMWTAEHIGADVPSLAEVASLFVRQSAEDGHAQFRNLPRRHQPSVRDASRRQPRAKSIIVLAWKPGYIANSATVEPMVNGVAEVTITLTKPRRVAFHGVVATVDGTGLPGVKVQLYGPSQISETDANGRYKLLKHSFERSLASFVISGGDLPLTHRRIDIPPTGDRIEHNFTVELRAPVTGQVVDQFGKPVAGVALHLGAKHGSHHMSTPEHTGQDGCFTFPDAIPSQDDLWVAPPEPQSAWRHERSRTLTMRDGEVITLQRLDSPLVDLAIVVVDGRNGTLISPTEIELQRLHGSSRNHDIPHLPVVLALGTGTVKQLPTGRYRAIVRATDGLQAEHTFTLTADEKTHSERVEVWPPSAVVCTVDASALPAATLALQTSMADVLLDPQTEQSYLVDTQGKRVNYRPNTGRFRIGSEMIFRLERVTANVPLRLRVLGSSLFGEVWFRALPGQDAHVTLRLQPFGKLGFRVPDNWPAGTIEVETHNGTKWQPLDHWRHAVQAEPDERSPQRPVGEVQWRLRLWPHGGEPMIEHTGTAEITAVATTMATFD